MKKRTVYLSKSNAANPDHVMLVRKYLQSLGFSVTEYQGGTYNDRSVLPASMFVMVGYEQDHNPYDKYYVGKGQYGQLEKRVNNHKSDNFYVISFTQDDRIPLFGRYSTDTIINTNNWSTSYGRIRPISSSYLQPRSFEILLEKEYEPQFKPLDGIDWKEVNAEEAEKINKHVGINDYLGIKDEPVKIHLACITLFQ
jgi:hypothetical protein